jgi:opacity protein-like surface antigen
MTRIISFAVVLVVSAAGVAANAQVSPLAMKAPPPVAAAASWSWTGLYIGGHLGSALEDSQLSDPFGAVSAGDNFRGPGFIGGAELGANYQIGNVVVGAAADLSWGDTKGDNTCFGVVGGNFFPSTCTVNSNLYGTITGRVGYALGHSLFYGKGGAAWERSNVFMSVNNNPHDDVLLSTTDYDAWGWTAGAGIEYALTPAWSLSFEYDFLSFPSENVATPYVVGNPLPGSPVGPIAGLSDTVQEAKLGLNYRIGADPTLWPSSASAFAFPSLLPLKAPPPSTASAWEIEGGSRYMYSWGRAQWETGDRVGGSRLTWYNLATNSAEIYGNVTSPWNVFLKGFVGVGSTTSGAQTDEDFDEPTFHRFYNDTLSSNTGHIGYAVVDLGYDVARAPDYKVGPFVGYTVFNQYIFKTGCQQIANVVGNCIAISPPLPSSQLIGTEDITWQAIRVGLSAQVLLAPRVHLDADAAYLPYVPFTWVDDHLVDGLEHFISGQAGGAQVQALVSYDVTDQLHVGIGGRYWAMWDNAAEFQTVPSTAGPGPSRNVIELAGAFVEAGYRFDPDSSGSKTATLVPFAKAPTPTASYNWTGLYGGIEGGGVWGQSTQIGQLTTDERHTANATPWFDVSGGLLGGTLGYNAEFYRRFVYGFEGDMSWVSAKGGAQQIAPFNTADTASTNQDWLATARTRIGVLPANGWLLYGTGGLAAADVAATITPGDPFTEERHVRPGWTAGGGIEAAITGNWSAKVEYLFVGLEDHSYFVPTPNIPSQTNRAGGVPLDNNIIRAGINYRITSLF